MNVFSLCEFPTLVDGLYYRILGICYRIIGKKKGLKVIGVVYSPLLIFRRCLGERRVEGYELRGDYLPRAMEGETGLWGYHLLA